MIEVLLKDCGVWVEVYSDDGLDFVELDKLAADCNLIAGANFVAHLPGFITVDCSKIAAVRVSR